MLTRTGEFGPAFSYYELSSGAKIWASFLMLLGRLELFTVLILLTPFFGASAGTRICLSSVVLKLPTLIFFWTPPGS